ncbi:hypothetical protein IV203_014939 [Nitzschia inconspicua]|uniref:Uncharacterized protein n=1 Tax=Nitzschia inconspicua TaxID=303405 RepID=A0A9K3LCT3_9STRA|nr:hypothetical protein IV203_014939 [Nitzschia inconspicua]
MSSDGTVACIHWTTATALRSVSHQNNEDVSLYNQGRFAEAIHVFKEATSASKAFLRRPIEVQGTATAELCLSLQVLPSQTALTNSMNSFVDHSVYLKPFEVVLTSGARPLINDNFVPPNNSQYRLFFSRLSTILIFNMALSHHAIAMVSTDGDFAARREFLSKARDLYNLAYSIPQGEQEHEVIDETILPLFVKAVLNNLGHCFASLDHTNNSVACYELLLRTIILF